MTIELRSGDAEDWPSIRELLAGDGLPVDDLDASCMGRFIVAVDSRGGVQGAVGLEALGRVALLRSLVVAPDQRGRGLGGRLVDRLESEAASQGAAELWLLTNTARPYFLARGYRDRSREEAPAAIVATREFSSLCPGDASLMSRSI